MGVKAIDRASIPSGELLQCDSRASVGRQLHFGQKSLARQTRQTRTAHALIRKKQKGTQNLNSKYSNA